MTFDKKAYQREYMRKKRLASGKKEAVAESELRGMDEVSPDNLPVPVLAEPPEADSLTQKREQDDSGEARESNATPDQAKAKGSDSRGGQNLSEWDQKKDEEVPGWYIFGTVERETNCWRCGKKYSTRLELSKFCSSKCKTEYLDSASHLRS